MVKIQDLYLVLDQELVLNLGETDIDILNFELFDVKKLLLYIKKYRKYIVLYDLQTYHIHKNDFTLNFIQF